MSIRINFESVRALLPLLTATCAAAPGLAQSQPPINGNTIPGLRLGMDEPTVQTFEQLSAARMSTSFDSDLVLLSDNLLTFYFQPTRFDTKTEFVGNHRDLAIAPGTDFDHVFTVDATGLVQWTFDEPNALYVSSVVDSNWFNVSRLDVTNSGLVVGWDPAAGKIRRYDPLDAPQQDILGETGTLHDLVAIDWNDDGADDFILQRDEYFEVIDGASGESLAVWNTVGTDNRVVATRGTGPDADLATWLFQIEGLLFLNNKNAELSNDGYLMLPNSEQVYVHPADLLPGHAGHANSSEELMVNLPDGRVWVFRRPPVEESEGGESSQPIYQLVPDFTPTNSTYYEFLQPAIDNGGSGIVSGAGDLDRDGDLEPIFGRHSDGAIQFQYDNYELDDHPIAKIDLAYVAASGGVELKVEASQLGRMPAGATHIVAEVWRHPGGNIYFDQVMIAREYIDIAVPPGTNPSANLILGSGHAFNDIHFVALRAVTVNGPAQTRTYPTIAEYDVTDAWLTLGGFSSEDPGQEPTYSSWSGSIAIQDLEAQSNNDDPVLTGSGNQTAQGSRTPPQLPPFGGVTKTGSTGI